MVREDTARDDMVLEDRREARLVLGLEQLFDRPLGKGRKGLVRRCEDRDRASPRESLDESGSLGGSNQGLEGLRTCGDLNDVLGLRHHHRVDDVNDAVRAVDVRRRHLGPCDVDGAFFDVDVSPLTVEGGRVLKLHHRTRLDGTTHDVELQDVLEQPFVGGLGDRSHHLLGELGKGSIRGRKNRKRAFTGEGANQVGARQESRQGVELAGGDGGLDNRLVRDVLGNTRGLGRARAARL